MRPAGHQFDHVDLEDTGQEVSEERTSHGVYKLLGRLGLGSRAPWHSHCLVYGMWNAGNWRAVRTTQIAVHYTLTRTTNQADGYKNMAYQVWRIVKLQTWLMFTPFNSWIWHLAFVNLLCKHCLCSHISSLRKSINLTTVRSFIFSTTVWPQYYLSVRLICAEPTPWYVSRGSSVSIVSGYGHYRAIEVRSPAEEDDFSCSLFVQTGSGTHPASCTIGTGGPFPGAKARPGRDADHSPPSSAEVKNE
jgi:hypothetical protein